MIEENHSLDLLKLIMSFAVVAIHAAFLGVYIYPAVRLAVPTFFLLTGYFAFRKIDRKHNYDERKRIFRRIIKRNFQLYICWSILLFPVVYYMRGFYALGFAQGMPAMLLSLAKGVSFTGSWYIFACIIALAIVFYLSRYLNNIWLLLLAIPFYLFATACSELSEILSQVPLLNLVRTGFQNVMGAPFFSFPIALIYIVLGKIVAQKEEKCHNKRFYLVGFLVCISGLYAEFCFVESRIAAVYNRDCYFMLAPAAYFLVMLVIKIPLRFQHALVMRKISTITYCVHGVVLAVVAKMLTMADFLDTYNIIRYGGTIAGCCILSLCIVKLEQKPGMAFLKYFH